MGSRQDPSHRTNSMTRHQIRVSRRWTDQRRAGGTWASLEIHDNLAGVTSQTRIMGRYNRYLSSDGLLFVPDEPFESPIIVLRLFALFVKSSTLWNAYISKRLFLTSQLGPGGSNKNIMPSVMRDNQAPCS